MKSLLRSTIVVGAMASAAALAPSVANAGVSIGIGVPAVIVGTGPGYVAYDEQYYYDPIYISGAWYHGPYRWRMWHGERMFFVNGRWHRNSGTDAMTDSTEHSASMPGSTSTAVTCAKIAVS